MKLWRLEAVRGAAAIYVLLGHSFPCQLFSLGQEAVMVFFLLSGFVIEYSSAAKLPLGFGAYFKRRFIRIYTVLLCLFVVSGLIYGAPLASANFWGQLCGNLLMLQDLPDAKPNVIVPALFSGALWSLHYEWWFYMFYFPIATRIAQEKQNQFVGLIGILCAITYLVFPNPLNRLLFYFPVWWIGVAMARQYRATGQVTLASARTPMVYVACICAILAGYALYYYHSTGYFSPGVHPFLEVRHLLAAIVAVGVAFSWQRLHWLGFSPLLSWGVWIAPISYALYIAHQPLFAYSSYLRGILPPWLEPFAYAGGLLVFCYGTELWLYKKLANRAETSRQRIKAGLLILPPDRKRV